jgi:hypothetical protein
VRKEGEEDNAGHCAEKEKMCVRAKFHLTFFLMSASAGPRAVLFFSSMYALVDMSLELSSGARQKRAWHHVLASSFAGATQAAGVGLNAAKGGLLGLALGIVSAPLYVYAFADGKAPSLLAIVAPRKSGGGAKGEAEGAVAETATAADSQSSTPPPLPAPPAAPKPLS